MCLYVCSHFAPRDEEFMTTVGGTGGSSVTTSIPSCDMVYLCIVYMLLSAVVIVIGGVNDDDDGGSALNIMSQYGSNSPVRSCSQATHINAIKAERTGKDARAATLRSVRTGISLYYARVDTGGHPNHRFQHGIHNNINNNSNPPVGVGWPNRHRFRRANPSTFMHTKRFSTQFHPPLIYESNFINTAHERKTAQVITLSSSTISGSVWRNNTIHLFATTAVARARALNNRKLMVDYVIPREPGANSRRNATYVALWLADTCSKYKMFSCARVRGL